MLAILPLLAYFPVLQNGFIWDDDRYLTSNPFLTDFEGLKHLWLDIRSRPQYYPMVFTSFWIEHQFWGLDPLGYHIDNVLLHCANSIILWRILVYLDVPAAWLVAGIFSLHPVHVESVAWITERKNVLSGLFYFLSLYTFLRFYFPRRAGFPEEGLVKNPSATLYGISLFFFVCALLSKTVTCTLPAVILLLFWWKQNRLNLKVIQLTIPFFIIGFGFAALTSWLEKVNVGALGPEWDFSFWDRFLIAGRALWFYVWKLVWPFPIIFTYPRWNIDDSVWWQYLFPATFLLLILALWVLRKKIGRGPLTAILFFAGSLFPALGFFNIYPMRFSYVADHFQYLASIGILLIIAGGIARLRGRPLRKSKKLKSEMLRQAQHDNTEPFCHSEEQRDEESRGYAKLPLRGRGAIASSILLLLFLGHLTWKQIPVYKNVFTLWSDTVEKNPNAWMAHYNLANIFIAEQKAEEAVAHYREAIRVKPEFALAPYNLGNTLLAQEKTEEAIIQYQTTLRLKPEFVDAYNNLGVALLKKGNGGEAIKQFRKALALKPDYADARNNLEFALDQIKQ